jgi:hypothetical protein
MTCFHNTKITCIYLVEHNLGARCCGKTWKFLYADQDWSGCEHLHQVANPFWITI